MVSLPNGTVQTGKQHTVTSSIVVGVYHGTTVERKELLPDSSLSHLELEAGVMTLGYVGHYEVFATSSRSSTERHGDFSESVVFHFAP